jgi:hypothetical protein
MSTSHTLHITALTALTALAACVAPGDDPLATTATSIQGGRIEYGDFAVGELRIGYRNTWDPSAYSNYCTATLLARDVALTAKHCLTSDPMKFIDGSFQAWVDDFREHPTKDLALVHLAAATDIQPMQVDSVNWNLSLGTTCIAVGFGAHQNPDGTVTQEVKRSAEELVTSTAADFTIVRWPGSGERPGLADHGDSGGPLLCGDLRSGEFPTQVTAVVLDHDENEVPRVHERYTTMDGGWVMQRLAEWSASAFPVTCQDLTDRYGISPIDPSFAPPDIQATFHQMDCATSPWSSDNCQRASELYGIATFVGYGFAPASVRTWWNNHGCWTAPLTQADLCQRASDRFGILENVSSGTAPPEIQTWWTANHCWARPASTSACQKAADLYGIFVDTLDADEFSFGHDFAWAPPAVQSWFIGQGCTASRRGDPCQIASDLYDLGPGNSTLAPGDVASWFRQRGCTTSPSGAALNWDCQRGSELYGLAGDGSDVLSDGFAPADVDSAWSQSECGRGAPGGFIGPLSANLCQKASDLYSITAGGSQGFAPPDVRSWFAGMHCTTRPH